MKIKTVMIFTLIFPCLIFSLAVYGNSQNDNLSWDTIENKPPVTLNQKDDGYRGIWYMNMPSNDGYVYKYSGGLGTYCAKHQPFAIYCREVNKTFFCYGGTAKDSNRHLHGRFLDKSGGTKTELLRPKGTL